MGRDLPSEPFVRPHLFGAYLENMSEYLRRRFPQAPPKEIEQFIRDYVETHSKKLQDNLKQALDNGEDITQPRAPGSELWPTIKVVKHIDPQDGSERHSYGNMKYFEHEDLLRHITKNRTKILSPFGTYYETTTTCESFLKGMIDNKKASRKAEKKAMLQAKKDGDRVKENFHNGMQASIKITMNSMPGGMGSGFNFLSSTANFNSVTSISRFLIMNAYAHAERFLESNFYFINEEQLINFIITCIRHGPDPENVLTIINKYGIKVPTFQEVYNFLIGELHKYMFPCDHPEIQQLISELHPGHLCFLFYMSNLKHLITENDWYWRPWIDSLFSDKEVPFSDVDPTDLRKLDGDLVVVLSTIYNKEIPTNDKGNTISAYDCIEKAPDLAKRFVCIGNYMQNKLDGIQELFNIFMNHMVGVGFVNEHKYMFRKTVISSDTDSIIFTNKNWVKWYTGNTKITDEAYNINALVVYFLSKANENIMYYVSRVLGATNKDLLTMAMKNEFMMPIDILTSLKKHYASILKIQEGVFYGKPRLDIKGVGLRGSNYSKGTLNYVEWFIKSAIDDIYNDGSVAITKKILEVLRFERFIYDSLRKGETQYLTVDPIKSAEEYKNAESSIYFNYLFWEHVFGAKYGNIMIPTKCFMLPLTDVRHFDYGTFLERGFPDISAKLTEFLEKYPDRPITRIPINPLTNQIPDELKPVINYKGIIYENSKPLYLVLNSFGLGNGTPSKSSILYSDSYGWVDSEEAQKATEHM